MSLRVRLFLAMVTVAVASVAVTALLSRDRVRQVVDAFVLQETMKSGAPGIESPFQRALDSLFAAVSDVDDLADARSALVTFTSDTGRGVVLLDDQTDPVVAAGVDPAALRIEPMDGGASVVVEWGRSPGDRRRIRGGLPLRGPDGALRGLLVVLPEGRPATAGEPEGPLGSIDRHIAAAAAVASGLALLASLLVARQISGPVTRLADATLRLARGDRSLRIASSRTDEVGRLVAAFNQLVDSLDRSEGLRHRLIADVAHELRTPLAGLQGEIEAMQDGLSRPDSEGLGALHQDVVHLGRLVRELQELAMAEAGDLELQLTPVDLTEEARSAVRALGLDGSGPPRVTVEGRPCGVAADPLRIRQILTNLLSNAVQHGRPGNVRVATAVAGDRAVLRIADDGRGIDPEALPHVFERLYRADTRDPGTRGTGLGLAITRELVRAHDGTIEVSSEPGRGTTFTVTLPLGSAEMHPRSHGTSAGA